MLAARLARIDGIEPIHIGRLRYRLGIAFYTGASLFMATERELEEWDAAARAHLENPDTIVLYGLLFLVWGRKRG